MSNKRANGYIDRSQVLANKQPNVASGIIAMPCIDRNKTGSLERHFKHKLDAQDNDPTMLTAMVVMNDICVLVLKSAIEGVEKVTFKVEVDSGSISGKRKKGAKILNAGCSVISLRMSDGSEKEFFAPIGGQLLETNGNLLSYPNLLFDQPCGTGFIAVIYPNTEFPSLTNSESYNKKSNAKNNICFDYAKGTCKRGNACKFKHEIESLPSAKKQKIDDSTDVPQIDKMKAMDDCSVITEKTVTDNANILINESLS
jgi:hypothetical protein